MSGAFVPFDAAQRQVRDILQDLRPTPDGIGDIYLVRNLYGKIRISVSDECQEHESARAFLRELAALLHASLGPRGFPPERGVLFVERKMLDTLTDGARKIRPGVYWADRLVTGSGWWGVGTSAGPEGAARFTLFSIKGGVGRSTTAAILAWDLARRGRKVLVVDLDLESPGLSSAMVERNDRPDFGVTDWFVEDLVGQGDQVLEGMTATPKWAQDFEGEVHIAPAHGQEPGEYLAKLGRVYMNTREAWTARLETMLTRLEERHRPEIVLVESRAGLHDIAAATVTDLGAQVLLFATDSESNWTDYGILFRHWRDQDLARRIRDRLWTVSALTPELDTARYLARFRQRAWDLFREHLYDEVASGGGLDDDLFSFDRDDDAAPHDPLPIHWNRGLAAGTSLRSLEQDTVGHAYADFLHRFRSVFEAGTEDPS